MLLQADKDKEKVASIIAKALQHQGGSNENLPDAAGGVPNISSSTPSSENATLAMHTMPIELSIHFERADKGLGLSIAGMYISIHTYILYFRRKIVYIQKIKTCESYIPEWKLHKLYTLIYCYSNRTYHRKKFNNRNIFKHICFLLLKLVDFFLTFLGEKY